MKDTKAIAPIQSNTLTVYQKVQDPLQFAMSSGKMFSSFINCTEEQGKAAALTALCEGLTPVEFTRRYHMIQGRPTMRSDAMLSEFKMNHGGKYKMLQRDENAAKIEFIDAEGNKYVEEFTWEEAQHEAFVWQKGKGPGMEPTAKNLKDNWATPRGRKQMLWARCVSDSLRYICPELVAGVYTPEEMQDVIIDAQVVKPSGPAKPSASEIIEAKAAEAEQQPEEKFTDVEPEPVATPEAKSESASQEPETDTTELVDRIKELFVDCFADNANEALNSALSRREVYSLNEMSPADLMQLEANLLNKKAAGN